MNKQEKKLDKIWDIIYEIREHNEWLDNYFELNNKGDIILSSHTKNIDELTKRLWKVIKEE
ncbi:MAG: hypothetical protein ACYCS1_05115 [Gammaproteobacteria bacterium]